MVVADCVDQTERHAESGLVERSYKELESIVMKGIIVVQKVKEPPARESDPVVPYERGTPSRGRFALDVRHATVCYGCDRLSSRAVVRIVQDDDLETGVPLGKSALHGADNQFLSPMRRNDDGNVGNHHVEPTIDHIRPLGANEFRRGAASYQSNPVERAERAESFRSARA
jgi:hypothetical protein